MVDKLTIQDFIKLFNKYPVLDVRSPGEYNHAHIPGAFSMPLFNDDERRIVGTTYKQQSREAAIKTGLDFFGPKMRKLVEEAENIVDRWRMTDDSMKVQAESLEMTNRNGPSGVNSDLSSVNQKIILVHCWRGGMRSAGVAWLLDLYGFKVYTLAGGYKAYRNFALQQFEKEYCLKVIGGYTGSGKTEVLQCLKQKGETILDLEALASHKGSAFGNLGQLPQPSQEMFENLLAMELFKKNGNPPSTIWIEDESQRIGNINLPAAFFKQKQRSKLYFLDIPFHERLNYIVTHYGKFEKEKLVNSIIRIKKRLGGLETKTAVNYLIEDDIKNCFAVLLKYYDKWYLKSLYNRGGTDMLMNTIPASTVDAIKNAKLIQELKNTIIPKTTIE